MATIKAKVFGYGGVSASVQFKDGVGQTDNPRLIAWFKEHGYEVDDSAEQAAAAAAEAAAAAAAEAAEAAAAEAAAAAAAEAAAAAAAEAAAGKKNGGAKHA